VDLEFLLRQIANGLIVGSTYGLVALGLTLVFGVLGVINLAQGELFMVGAFAGLVTLNAGLPFPLALIAGPVAAALVGLAMYVFVLRRLPQNVDPHVPMIATMAAAVVVQQLATRMFTARQHPYPTPDSLAGIVHVGPIAFETLNAFIFMLALVVVAGLYVLVLRTRLGLAIRAVAENPRMAALLGIGRDATISAVFVISSALAGIAGVLVAMFFNNVSPYIGIPIGMKGLAAVILGGLGSITGALVAGLVIGVAEVVTVAYVDSSWRDAVAFVVMIAILLARPTGLFGKPALERV
jgi:branched-chain amino acid transport system permease protein